MEIDSLSNRSDLSLQIATWYYDHWFGPSSAIQISELEKGIVDKINLKSNIPHFYVMLKERELVGVVELKYRENINHPEYIHWAGGLFVHRSYRNMGVASALIKHLLLRAAELDLGDLYLQCEPGLVEFYQNLGFVHLHSSKHGELETEVMVGRILQKNRT